VLFSTFSCSSDPLRSDELRYQQQILQRVSRSFALTIPQLPDALCDTVGNAYLLCRIADTIEDEPSLSYDLKSVFIQQFIAVVANQHTADSFSHALLPHLSTDTSPAEKDLIDHTADVIRITQSFNPVQQAALLRCVQIMSKGMADFQQREDKITGLPNKQDLQQYCYYVAGVVGEMLTSLFCDYSPAIAAQQAGLQRHSVAFGEGLQLTNILKDIWADRQRGECWLPRDVFQATGFDLSIWYNDESCVLGQANPAFRQGIKVLLNQTREQLQSALEYSLLIPSNEPGIRRFCLWAIGMAVLTLRNIAKQPGFYSGEQVKISRKQVRRMIYLSYVLINQDTLLRWLFKRWTADI